MYVLCTSCVVLNEIAFRTMCLSGHRSTSPSVPGLVNPWTVNYETLYIKITLLSMIRLENLLLLVMWL